MSEADDWVYIKEGEGFFQTEDAEIPPPAIEPLPSDTKPRESSRSVTPLPEPLTSEFGAIEKHILGAIKKVVAPVATWMQNPVAVHPPSVPQVEKDHLQKQGQENRARLQEKLQLYQMEIRGKIVGDGNCQFAALADQLYRNVSYARTVRTVCVDWLVANGDLVMENGATLHDFVHDRSWSSYCEEMYADGTWGDHLTIYAAAHAFDCQIFIFCSSQGMGDLVEVVPLHGRIKRRVYLAHWMEYHYESVQPLVR